MRILALLLALPLCAAPALAQTGSPSSAPAASATEQSAAATPESPTPQARASQTRAPQTRAPRAGAAHRRGGWEQHFAAANTSHDGHLTLQQARSGYVTVARHFSQIDTAHKGYVTTDDIQAWHKAQREARHRPAGSERAQARPAMHRTMLDPLNLSSGPPAPPTGIAPRS